MMTLKKADPRTYQVGLGSWSMHACMTRRDEKASNLLRKGAPSEKEKKAPEKEKKQPSSFSTIFHAEIRFDTLELLPSA